MVNIITFVIFGILVLVFDLIFKKPIDAEFMEVAWEAIISMLLFFAGSILYAGIYIKECYDIYVHNNDTDRLLVEENSNKAIVSGSDDANVGELTKQLKELKSLLDAELITEEEYGEKKKKILDI